MALVRILIDGYSLLHSWPELVPDRPRHSGAAREELIRLLTLYRDATHTPISIFFDGAGAPPGAPRFESSLGLEVLFSRAGQTADEMIERAAHRFKAFGEALVVTDDQAEREVVSGMGGLTSSCLNFIRMVECVLREFDGELEHYNQRERLRFSRRS